MNETTFLQQKKACAAKIKVGSVFCMMADYDNYDRLYLNSDGKNRIKVKVIGKQYDQWLIGTMQDNTEFWQITSGDYDEMYVKCDDYLSYKYGWWVSNQCLIAYAVRK